MGSMLPSIAAPWIRHGLWFPYFFSHFSRYKPWVFTKGFWPPGDEQVASSARTSNSKNYVAKNFAKTLKGLWRHGHILMPCIDVIHGMKIWINYYWIYTGWCFEPYPSEKWWSSSVGMMTFPIWWNQKKIQTTNQYIIGITYWRMVMSLRNAFQNSNMGLTWFDHQT